MTKALSRFFLGMLLVSSPCLADTVKVLAIEKNKAVVRINNLEEQVMAPDSVVDGVRFVRISGRSAEFVIQGMPYSLAVGELAMIMSRSYVAQPPRVPKVIQIRESRNGQYLVDGTINGVPVRFQVDTGANTVAISPAEAGRIGISFWNGKRGVGNTAAGKVESFSGNCGEIALGSIRVANVLCSVLVSADSGALSTAALLGMSFLRHVNMKQEKGILTLSQD